jgi:ATP-dependent DNA ligase
LLAEEYRERLRPAKAEFIAPMLATLTTSYFSDAGWLFERKLDGVRTLAVRAGHGTRLYSRNHKPMNAPYPEIAEALGAQAPDGMVADGEIVAFDGDQTSFSMLQARIGLSDPNRARATGVPVILYLFDLLVLDGYDLTGLPLRERKRLLGEAVDFADPIRFSEHRDTDGQAYLKQACAAGWEGLIAKRGDAAYHPGARSKDWLKFKCVHEQELVIGGFTDPAGSRHRPGPRTRRALGRPGTGRRGRVRRVDPRAPTTPPPLPGTARRQSRHRRRPGGTTDHRHHQRPWPVPYDNRRAQPARWGPHHRHRRDPGDRDLGGAHQ